MLYGETGVVRDGTVAVRTAVQEEAAPRRWGEGEVWSLPWRKSQHGSLCAGVIEK